MKRPQNSVKLRAILGLSALALLAGCGIKTGLDRPDPMWGTASAQRADAERKAEADALAAERAARTGHAVTPPPAETPMIPEPGQMAPSTAPTTP